MIAPPTFASLQEHISRLGDAGLWWPYVAEILERHDLADEVAARLANLEDSKARRPTPNRKAAIDRSLHAVTSSVSHRGFTPGQGDAHARW